jgi:hypothetical protein
MPLILFFNNGLVSFAGKLGGDLLAAFQIFKVFKEQHP